MNIKTIAKLFASVKKELDIYDCTELEVTISTNDRKNWNFQTGDNSFIGACYGDRYWEVAYLTKHTNCYHLAKNVVSNLKDQIAWDMK